MLRVLIVDDSSFMRSMIKTILEKNNCQVIAEATNGFDAISMYNQSKPDVVFMDITMNNLSGLDALKTIMNNNSNAKVVMCSAMGQQGIVVEAIQYGAIDFIVKPFQEERIVEVLNKIKL